MGMGNDRLLDFKSAAAYLRLSRASLDQAVRGGFLKPTEISPQGYRLFSIENLNRFYGIESDSPLEFLKSREAAEYLRVCLFTLNRMQNKGRLVPLRTPGGHRRYTVSMLNAYLASTQRRGSRPV